MDAPASEFSTVFGGPRLGSGTRGGGRPYSGLRRHLGWPPPAAMYPKKSSPALKVLGQYSEASIMVRTRAVFAGSAGSSDPPSSSRL